MLPGRRAARLGPRTVAVAAPRWSPPSGSERLLAQAYRDAVAAADLAGATSMVLPSTLARTVWPLADVTRVALTVLMSTPSTLREVTIAVPTPAALETWAEALAREP